MIDVTNGEVSTREGLVIGPNYSFDKFKTFEVSLFSISFAFIIVSSETFELIIIFNASRFNLLLNIILACPKRERFDLSV